MKEDDLKELKDKKWVIKEDDLNAVKDNKRVMKEDNLNAHSQKNLPLINKLCT